MGGRHLRHLSFNDRRGKLPLHGSGTGSPGGFRWRGREKIGGGGPAVNSATVKTAAMGRNDYCLAMQATVDLDPLYNLGSKSHWAVQYAKDQNVQQRRLTCDICHGVGEFKDTPCIACEGLGYDLVASNASECWEYLEIEQGCRR
jgi:hypothetical protein